MEGPPQPPDNPHLKAKTVLRKHIRAELKKMSPADRATASLQACSLLKQQPLWQRANSILFYAPLPEELDIWKLLVDSLAAGKTVTLPRFVPEQNAYVACHITDHQKDIR